jgi:uncharacterized protein GlcG (DUF336 family)
VGRVSRFEITLDLAQEMMTATRNAATAAGIAVSIAVVDAGGHLVGFARMDGAEIAGPILARDKAFTSVAHRIETSELTTLVAPGGELAGMNTADSGRYIAFPGGLPCWDSDRVIGAIGVSGGSADQDEACARAGLTVYLQAQQAS